MSREDLIRKVEDATTRLVLDADVPPAVVLKLQEAIGAALVLARSGCSLLVADFCAAICTLTDKVEAELQESERVAVAS